MNQRASILVGLLWCLTLLSVVVIGILHTTRFDLLIVKNYGDEIQAHYLALAGVEKAKALLYHQALDRKRSGKNHVGDLYDSPEDFRDIHFGRGEFRVFRQGREEEGGKVMYGITDEESRLNVNHASAEELGKIDGMTPEIVASILQYRGENSNGPAPDLSVDNYFPRKGPLETTRELLMVRGVPRDLFLGEDANQNGLLDPEEDDGNVSYPPDNRDGLLDAGWSGMLTVDSMNLNVNAAGDDRVNIRSADESTLGAVRGISSDLAKAIVAYRGQNRLENLADLLDVTQVRPQQPQVVPSGPPRAGGSSGAPSGAAPGPGSGPGAGPMRGRGGAAVVVQPPQQGNTQPAPGGPAPVSAPSGEKLISEELLMGIADDVTADQETELPGRVNINTASSAVLACLPGLNLQLAQAIVSYRQANGFFSNIAGILKVPGMNAALFKQVSPRVTARSETFRILSEGKVNSSGARKRIQVIVHIGRSEVETLSYREDL